MSEKDAVIWPPVRTFVRSIVASAPANQKPPWRQQPQQSSWSKTEVGDASPMSGGLTACVSSVSSAKQVVARATRSAAVALQTNPLVLTMNPFSPRGANLVGESLGAHATTVACYRTGM